MDFIIGLLAAMGLTISSEEAGLLIAAGATGILKEIGPSIVNNMIELFDNASDYVQLHQDEFLAGDIDAIKKYNNSIDSVRDFWKLATKKAGTEELGAFGTAFVIPQFIYKAALVVAKYVTKVGNKIFDITFNSGKSIDNVQGLVEAIGYNYEQFTRDVDPASVTAWANIAMIYRLLEKGIPMVQIQCVPNADLEGITEGVTDYYGEPWYDRCAHNYYLVPLHSFRDTDAINISDIPYPGTSDDWEAFTGDFGIPEISGGYNSGVNSAQFSDAIKGLKREANGDIKLEFDWDKLSSLGITAVMLLPLFSVAGSTAFPITSQLHSKSIFGAGPDALKEFLTSTYITGDVWTRNMKTYFKDTTIAEWSNSILFPNVVLHPMQSNAESGGRNNILDSGGVIDWFITIAGIAIGASGGYITRKAIIKPQDETVDALTEDALDLVTPANTISKPSESVDSRTIEGDKVGDVEVVKATDIGKILAGEKSITDALERVGDLVNTKTGTLILNPDKTIDDAIDDISNTPSGATSSIPPTGTGVAANSMISIWSPTPAQLSAFTKKLWSKDLIDNLLKLLGDPMDACISLQKVAINPVIDGERSLVLGNYNTGIPMRHVASQYATMDLGGINIPPKFGNYLDCDPYTEIVLYLPFVGFTKLSATSVIGHAVNVVYNVELLTGSCLAMVKREGVTIATYTGQISMQLPITGQNYSRVISGAANGVMSGAPAGVAGAVTSGIIGAMGNLEHTLQTSGSMSINSGFLGSFKPYVIISRPIPYSGAYQNVRGYVQNQTDYIRNFSGYCTFEEVDLRSDGQATKEELDEIKAQLSNGVIL